MNEKRGGITIKGKVKQRIRWRIRERWTEREERDPLRAGGGKGGLKASVVELLGKPSINERRDPLCSSWGVQWDRRGYPKGWVGVEIGQEPEDEGRCSAQRSGPTSAPKEPLDLFPSSPAVLSQESIDFTRPRDKGRQAGA